LVQHFQCDEVIIIVWLSCPVGLPALELLALLYLSNSRSLLSLSLLLFLCRLIMFLDLSLVLVFLSAFTILSIFLLSLLFCGLSSLLETVADLDCGDIV
jgi:hypothetical protein